jgi:hypothetical protein
LHVPSKLFCAEPCREPLQSTPEALLGHEERQPAFAQSAARGASFCNFSIDDVSVDVQSCQSAYTAGSLPVQASVGKLVLPMRGFMHANPTHFESCEHRCSTSWRSPRVTSMRFSPTIIVSVFKFLYR